jgi:hypothetical protein
VAYLIRFDNPKSKQAKYGALIGTPPTRWGFVDDIDLAHYFGGPAAAQGVLDRYPETKGWHGRVVRVVNGRHPHEVDG